MVWRIHFGEDDLARIQVSPTLGPLAETVLAVGMLRCTQQPRTLLSEWRGQVSVSPRMTPLTALIPPDCRGVDLPTLVGETATIEQGLQALLTVPRAPAAVVGIPLEPGASRSIGIIQRSGRTLAPAADAFARLLLQASTPRAGRMRRK